MFVCFSCCQCFIDRVYVEDCSPGSQCPGTKGKGITCACCQYHEVKTKSGVNFCFLFYVLKLLF